MITSVKSQTLECFIWVTVCHGGHSQTKKEMETRKKEKSKVVGYVKEKSVKGTYKKFSSEPCVRKGETQTCRKKKSSKQVHFSVLPAKYEPLEEDTASDTTTEKNHKKKQKYKRFRKVCALLLKFTCDYGTFKTVFL